MTDQQFTLLIIVLMLGFGGAFAGGFTLGDVMIGVMIGAAWFAVCIIWGTIDWIAGREYRERERVARRQNWLSDAKHELWQAQRDGTAWKIRMLTEHVQRLEREVGPERPLFERRRRDEL